MESKQQGQDIFRKRKVKTGLKAGHIPGDWKTGTSVFLLMYILVGVWLDISVQSVSLLLLFIALLWVLDAWTTIGDFDKLNRIRYEAELKRNEIAETA